MKTLYDVQQLLKQFGIVVYLGKRLYDIEMMKIELEASTRMVWWTRTATLLLK